MNPLNANIDPPAIGPFELLRVLDQQGGMGVPISPGCCR